MCKMQKMLFFFTNKIRNAGNDRRKLYRNLDNLTGHKKKKSLPEGFNESELPKRFLNFLKKRYEE